jgi:uncharacterized membrane protein YhiD involved in acid resistance
VFHQRLTYAVAGLTVLETLTALNILHHFTFVVEQSDNDFANAQQQMSAIKNHKNERSTVLVQRKRIKSAEVCKSQLLQTTKTMMQ